MYTKQKIDVQLLLWAGKCPLNSSLNCILLKVKEAGVWCLILQVSYSNTMKLNLPRSTAQDNQ